MQMDPAAARCANSLAEDLKDPVELVPGEIRTKGSFDESSRTDRRCSIPHRDFGDNLLCEDVRGGDRHGNAVELAGPNPANQSHAFEDLVAVSGDQLSLRRESEGVARTAHPLQERADGARRADLNHQVDTPPRHQVPARRRGGDDGLELAVLEGSVRFFASNRQRATHDGC